MTFDVDTRSLLVWPSPRERAPVPGAATVKVLPDRLQASYIGQLFYSADRTKNLGANCRLSGLAFEYLN